MEDKKTLKKTHRHFIKTFSIILLVTLFPMEGLTFTKPKVIILIGSPGSGKGTFSQIVKKYNYVHLSTGDVLRDQVHQKTEVGIKYKSDIENGTGVPWNVVTDLIRDKITKILSDGSNLILDGYPQSPSQVTSLYAILKDLDLIKYSVVVYLDIDKDTALSRLEDRMSCVNCNFVYNLKSYPPKERNTCNDCQSTLTKRKSDTDENKKIRIYKFFKNKEFYLTLFNPYSDIRFLHLDASNLHHDVPKKYINLLNIK